MRIVIDQTFERVDLERFIATYFSEAFNNGAASVLGLRERRLVELRTDDDGKEHRRVRMVVDVDLPRPVRLLIGDADISYDEVSTYDPKSRTVDYVIESAAQDRVHVGGRIFFEEAGADRVRRRIEGEVRVRVPGLSGVIERIVRREVKKSYQKLAVYMQRFLDESAGSLER